MECCRRGGRLSLLTAARSGYRFGLGAASLRKVGPNACRARCGRLDRSRRTWSRHVAPGFRATVAELPRRFRDDILRSLNLGGFAQGLIPISNVSGEGMVNLESALSRTINLGDEVED